MAIVKCRFCEGPVSDKAVVCPSCGKTLLDSKCGEGKKLCPECGEVLPENAEGCPSCGCPVEVPEQEKLTKVCPECGEVLPENAEGCPSCGCPVEAPEQEKLTKVCPECGEVLPENAEACPSCGCPVERAGENNRAEGAANPPSPLTQTAPKVKKTKIVAVIVAAAAVLMIVIGAVYFKNNTLTGDDKVAYELVYQAATNFKNPSSVRLVSGTLGVEKDCLFCGISATNGFGARTSGYYFVMGGYVLEEEDPTILFTDTSELNIELINKKLAKSLASY